MPVILHNKVLKFCVLRRIVNNLDDGGVVDFAHCFDFFLESGVCFLRGVFVEYFECARGLVGVVFVVYEVDRALSS